MDGYIKSKFLDVIYSIFSVPIHVYANLYKVFTMLESRPFIEEKQFLVCRESDEFKTISDVDTHNMMRRMFSCQRIKHSQPMLWNFPIPRPFNLCVQSTGLTVLHIFSQKGVHEHNIKFVRPKAIAFPRLNFQF